MASTKVLISFSFYTDEDFLIKAKQIISSLTGNVNFEEPDPALADVCAAINSYADALIALNPATAHKTELKNNARTNLENMLRTLGLYVQITGGNNRAILLTSGFNLSKEQQPADILPQPAIARVWERDFFNS